MEKSKLSANKQTQLRTAIWTNSDDGKDAKKEGTSRPCTVDTTRRQTADPKEAWLDSRPAAGVDSCRRGGLLQGECVEVSRQSTYLSSVNVCLVVKIFLLHFHTKPRKHLEWVPLIIPFPDRYHQGTSDLNEVVLKGYLSITHHFLTRSFTQNRPCFLVCFFTYESWKSFVSVHVCEVNRIPRKVPRTPTTVSSSTPSLLNKRERTPHRNPWMLWSLERDTEPSYTYRRCESITIWRISLDNKSPSRY